MRFKYIVVAKKDVKPKHETLFIKSYAAPSCDIVAICMEMTQCPIRGFYLTK